jgi:hypothetical protein
MHDRTCCALMQREQQPLGRLMGDASALRDEDQNR